MHEKFGAHNVFMDGEFLRFRQRFLEEELREVDEAIEAKDPDKLVDSIIDLCVVAIGTLDLGKINVYKAWDDVFDKNMQKRAGENSTRSGSKGFDLVKPEGWIPPSHVGNLGDFPLAIEGIHLRKIGFKPESEDLPSHIKIMDEFREFALAKDDGYNDQTDPEFSHASYYPDGIDNITYELYKKIKRFRSGLKKFSKGRESDKILESLKDGPRDINIYAAIAEAYMRGVLEGQSKDRDIFNRKKKNYDR